MANANLRVIGHFEANGKTLTHFGSGIQFLVTASMAGSGELRPDATSIKTVLANHSKVPPGATFVIDGVANLDREHNAGVVLT